MVMTANKQTKIGAMHRAHSGYSLLQMAIALMVVGILVGSFIQAYLVYNEGQKITKTQATVEMAVAKIQTFRQSNGRYPCVAPLDAARGDADYGVESTCSDDTLGTGATVAPGNCVAGICIERTNRAIDDDGDPLTAPVATDIRVRVGAIPFRVLQIDEADTFDAYGSRLVYVMTERMGDVTTFNEQHGGIAVINENNESQVDPAGSVAFLVVSPGKNRVGAFSKFGGLTKACADSGLDLQNCRDMAAPPVDATYAATFVADATEATTFDDFIQFFASVEIPLWRRETATSNNIVDLADQNVGVGTSNAVEELTIAQSTVRNFSLIKCAVGVPLPCVCDPLVAGGTPVGCTPTDPLGQMQTTNSTANNMYESGALRARGASKIRADVYCDKTDANCFQTKNFVGDNDTADATSGMKCPAGEYLIGITSDGTNAVPDCAAVRVYCSAAGTSLTGLNADGSPICSPIASSCTTGVRTLCTVNDITLPDAPSGNTFWYTKGDCRTISYTCNNGVWTNSAATGACTNSSTTSAAISCGVGYSAGSTYTTTTWACGGPGSSTWAANCAPNCTGYTKTGTLNCAWPLTGGPFTRSEPYTCDAGGNLVAGVPGAWSGSCGCGYADKYEFADCPAGKIRSATPAPAAFPVAGTAPATAWPAAVSKGWWRLNTVNTTTCTYNNPGYDSSNCVCDMTPKYDCWNPSPAFDSCTKGQSGGRTVSGKYCDWKYDIVSIPKDAACNYNNAAATILSAAVGVPRTYSWKTITGIINANQPTGAPHPAVGSNSVSPETGAGCNCSTVNATASCWVANAALKYDFYTCKCQEY
jgi:type II secretory pathway pseudopilin PulG